MLTVSQTPSWRIAAQLPLRGELRKRALLVVALLGSRVERLVAEHVDAGVHPVVEAAAPRGTRSRGRRPASSTTPNGERTCATTIVAAAPDRSCSREQRAKSTSSSSSPFNARHVPVLAPPRRRETQAAAAPERLGLADRVDLGAETRERVHERLLLPGAARDDHARRRRRATSRATPVLGERKAGDRHERLRQALRRVAEPLRLAAREEQRLHQTLELRLALRSGSAGDACRGRPIPS